MAGARQRIVISGYYGFGNSGDEAVLRSILAALEEQGEQAGVRIEPVVLSIQPELTSRMYGVEAVHRMRPREVFHALRGSDGLISGGGSLLQDVTGIKTIPYYLGVIQLAQWLGKPTFMYAQGVGPVARRLFDPMIRAVLAKCRYLSVRDQESAQLLAAIGLPLSRIDVVPDPVMGLPLPKTYSGTKREEGQLPVVGVSVRFWRKDRADLLGMAAALAKLMNARACIVRFLPFHEPHDHEASRYVMDEMKRLGASGDSVQLAEGIVDPQQMLAETAACDLLIGMRLHSLIYAASQYVPMAAVSYDPKIDQFMGRLGMRAVVTTDSFRADLVTAEAVHLLEGREEWLSGTRAAIDELKQKSQVPAQQIVAWIRNKG